MVIKSEQDTIVLLKCLYTCIDFDESWKTPSDWNKVDDVLEEICKRLVLEQDQNCLAVLFLFISKLTTLPIKQQEIIQKCTDFTNLKGIMLKSKESDEIVKLRDVCSKYHNLLCCRWMKNLKQIFLNQKLFGRPADIQLVIHVSFLYE